MRKRVLATLAALAVSLGIFVVATASPAAAALSCTNHRTHSVGWGSGHVCISIVSGGFNLGITEQDTQTDGSCVIAEARFQTQSGNQVWFLLDGTPGNAGELDDLGNTESCGANVISNVVAVSSGLKEVRMVREFQGGGVTVPFNGGARNFETIWPD